MPNFKVVNVHRDVAMQTPKKEYFRDQGISAYSCLIPQTRNVAHEVHFVSGDDGEEYGQFDDEQKARDQAFSVVRKQRRALDDSPSP